MLRASGDGATTIANDAVTFAKMQNIGATSLIGRHSSGSGDPEQVGVGGGLEFQGANIRREALTGDVTAPAGDNSTTIANDAVSNAKLANMAEATIKGTAGGERDGRPGRPYPDTGQDGARAWRRGNARCRNDGWHGGGWRRWPDHWRDTGEHGDHQRRHPSRHRIGHNRPCRGRRERARPHRR
jgi:hypothetical protein